MSNRQLTAPDDQDLFLEFLLRCALTAPGAASSPTAGRILARLLVVGAIEGGDRLVTPYLVPVPGEDAVFEVRAYHPGNLEPTEIRSGLGAAAALRIALRAARDSDDGIEVVSQAESGLERCVLVRDSTGDFEFRFAGGETLNGHPAECAAARRSWTATLAEWRAWVAEEHPTPLVTSPVERMRTMTGSASRPEQLGPAPAPAPVPAHAAKEEGGGGSDDVMWRSVDLPGRVDRVVEVGVEAAEPEAAPPRPPTPLRGWWVPQRGDDDHDEADAGAVVDTAPEPVREPAPDAVREPAPEPAPEPEPQPGREPEPAWAFHPAVDDEADDDEAEAEADEDPFLLLELGEDPPPSGPLRIEPLVPGPFERPPYDEPADDSPPAPVAVVPSPTFDMAAVIAAVQDGLANLTVKPDLSQMEELIARAMTGDRDLVEPLARRLSSRLGESLGRHDTHDFIEALLPLIPRPGEVAEAVTADVTALLSEVILRRRTGELSGGLEGQGIVGAIEQLQVQVDGMHDQLRKSTGALQSIDERLEVSDRRAVAAERIGASIEQEMQRLAMRIDEQVAALAGSAGGGSELADGVARLTRKLRQSVAQLDRALVRLDEVVEHPAVVPVLRPGVRPGVPGPAADQGPAGPAAAADQGPAGPIRRLGVRPGVAGPASDAGAPVRPGRRYPKN